jgi:hypothetical protein
MNKRNSKNLGNILRRLNKVAITIAPLSVALSGQPQAQPTLPIIVSATVDLNFGTFFTTGASGTVRIDTTGTRSTTGGVMTSVGAGLESQGQISISASTGVVMSITITPASYNLTNGLGDTMLLNGFNLDTTAGGPAITRSLTQNPSTIPVGATLNVGSPQAEGDYTGTYTINVVYQ